MANEDAFEGWAIVELMGHRKLAGLVKQVDMFGGSFLRLDVPEPIGDGFAATQFYGASAIYCLTPTTESQARQIARHQQPAPVHRWELPCLPAGDRVPMEEDDP